MAKRKGPGNFKLYAHQFSLLQDLPDEVLGNIMHKLMAYFVTGVEPEMQGLEKAVFACLRGNVEEAKAQYQRDVENGKKSARVRAEGKESEAVATPLNTPEGIEVSLREADADAEADTEADTDADADTDAEASSEKKKNMLLCVRSGATFPVSPPESDVRRGKKKCYDTG